MGSGDKPLKDYFSADQYARLNAFANDSLGINLAMLQQMKPVMLQTLFTTKAISCMIPVSYEANIMEEAKRQQLNVSGLEAAEEQLNVLNSMQDDTVAQSLVQMADSFSESRAAFQKMLAAYKAQDLPALYDQIKESKELGDDLGVFLDDRNEKWIPRMQDKMKNKPVFFAVGAGHLWGDQGVINLLREAGYVVEAVK
ncbi:GumN protein [Ostertagia ostertagi]